VRSCAGWLRRGSVATALVLTLCAATSQPAGANVASSSQPPVTTCASLGNGATGAAVKTIQNALGVSADGDFGKATAKALRKWQRAHDLSPTGVVDAPTWAALPAATGQKACGERVRGHGVTLGCAVLSSGATGLAVAVLQKMVGTAVNGVFGGPTVDAVEAVQQAAKLPVTGVTDRPTWKALTLFGSPECSTAHSILTSQSADAKAQAKVRKQVLTLVSELEKRPGTTKNQVALQAMAFAKRQIGKPYIWGGTGPKGFDCSGLQMKAFLHAGLTIPRTAAEQYAGAGKYVPLNQAKQGDLLFYASDVTKPSTVYHVAMYVGGGQLLDAPQTGEDVQITPMWTTDLLPVVVRPVATLKLPVKLGATGSTVTQLQQDLNRHGAALTVDGGFGPATDTAVRAWQQAHKLTPNGIVDVATWLSLK
jgi:cell wall-associated NlpC family hydrolase